MKIVTTVVLATRIFLALGIGTAMAQSLNPGTREAAYMAGQRQVASKSLKQHAAQAQVRSGSSSVGTVHLPFEPFGDE
jgi:hypothetical protein